jgi:hypothetical protein
LRQKLQGFEFLLRKKKHHEYNNTQWVDTQIIESAKEIFREDTISFDTVYAYCDRDKNTLLAKIQNCEDTILSALNQYSKQQAGKF